MPSHLIVRRRNVPPDDQVRVRCKVCGFYLDPDRTQQPELTPTQYVVTGSVYFATTPTGEIDRAAINKAVEGHVPIYGACPLCGSGKWQDGSPGPLKSLP